MVSVGTCNGKPVIRKDDRVIFPYAYMSYLKERADYEGFVKAGYGLYSVCCYLGDHGVNENSEIAPFDRGLYENESGLDFSPLDDALNRLVRHDDKASVILRINLNVPTWWRKKNPDELVKLSDDRTYMQSASSLKWREFAKEQIENIYGHIQSSPYKDNVIAFHLGAMQTEEWLAMQTGDGALDYSEPFKNYYHSWLKNKYNVIERLNNHWGSEYKAFEEVRLPTREEYLSRDGYTFLNHYKYAFIEDYLKAFSEATADAIVDLSRFTKSLVKDSALVGVFYGYVGQVPAGLGHNRISKLIDEPSIDFFASPVAYNNGRQGACDFFYHSVIDSVKKRNKLWFFENDIRTDLSRYPYEYGLSTSERCKNILTNMVWLGPKSKEESLSVLVRSFSKCFLHNDAYWWFDMWGGFYDDPSYMDFMKKSLGLIENSTVKENNEIAVILDEDGAFEVSDRYFYEMAFSQLSELGYVGCSYDIYSVNDVDDEMRNKYKALVYILPCTKTRLDLELNNGTGNYVWTKKRTYYSDVMMKKENLLLAVKSAGVFPYSYKNIVYNSDDYVCLTSVSDGDVLLNLPDNERLESVFDERVYEGNQIHIDMKYNETILFKRTRL